MKECKNCKAVLNDTDVFCPSCGIKSETTVKSENSNQPSFNSYTQQNQNNSGYAQNGTSFSGEIPNGRPVYFTNGNPNPYYSPNNQMPPQVNVKSGNGMKVWAIINLVIGVLLLSIPVIVMSIIALVKSSQINSEFDPYQAKSTYNTALTLNIISTIIVAIGILFLVFVISIGLSEFANQMPQGGLMY